MSKKIKCFLSFFLCLSLVSFCSSVQPAYGKAASGIAFVILSKYKANVDIGSEFYIIAVTTNGKLPTWKSSHSSIASVNTYGKVTAKKAGTVTITAKIKNAEASCKVTINKTLITLSTQNASIERGQKLKLSATTSNKSQVSWKSSKPSIATVDETGTVTGIKPGQASIIATSDGSSVTCSFKVKAPTISLSKTKLTLYRNQQYRLTANVSSKIPPVWKTNKKSIAFVDESGLVTAVKNGTAVITAMVDGVEKSCYVTVIKPDITLSSSELTLKKGTSATIKAVVSSGNSPIWSSSNSNVVTVDKAGNITGIKKGTAIIYASEDGTKVKCTVRVTE